MAGIPSPPITEAADEINRSAPAALVTAATVSSAYLHPPFYKHISTIPPVTVTFTDVTFTTIESTLEDSISSTIFEPPASNGDQDTNAITDRIRPENTVDDHLYRLLPFLAVFAAIGMLAIFALLIYLGYRFFRAGRHPTEDENYPGPHVLQSPSSGHTSILPWFGARRSDREAMTFDNSARDLMAHKEAYQEKREPNWLDKMPWLLAMVSLLGNGRRGRRRRGVRMENVDQPISNTFVPDDTSPLTLVPRMEIWQDPQRRRGVDELALWEDKQHHPPRSVYQFASESSYLNSPNTSSSQLVAMPTSSSSAHSHSSETTVNVAQPSPEEYHAPSSAPLKESTSRQPSAADDPASFSHAAVEQSSVSSCESNYPRIATTRSSPLIQRHIDDITPNHVTLGRSALQFSVLQNSSSQWLRPSGSSKSF
ncbi:hypothetical protein BCR43DRAFT_509723 [Syncephalastrum racemosum]|uniref:Uncharacterized protein n=1 Tax=Syncephalastrum racemosum TaxID=13706 RepID=A0A1X2HTX8_SYNRA|nr:hypothetical protein BCR43DRAFT_509723 [Syncephalastrum racemosum]